MDDSYDRMNPEAYQMLDRLEAYANIDYGAEAYPLSVAEARLILDMIYESPDEEITIA